ncbi:MAG: DMT family transporter [Proteobacteria bacterium]|nr:DMT family transporter [Pseudomonadota bacterium]
MSSQTAVGSALPPPKSIAALLLLAVMWGLSIPITKLGVLTLPPLTLTALRFAIAVPLLLLLVVGRKRLPLRAVPRMAGLGVLGIGVGQVAQTFGVAGTSASVGTIISATIPVFIVFFAAVRLKQAVSGRQKLGLLAAFAGIGLVALGDGTEGLFDSSAVGAAWVLLSALTIAFYYVWSVELTGEYGTPIVAAWSTLFGFLALLPWAGWEMARTPIHLTVEAVAAAAYLGIVVTTAGLFLWLSLLRTVPARIAASVQYLQPIVGVALSSAMFGDKLGVPFALGVVLVLAGLALSLAPNRESSNAA